MLMSFDMETGKAECADPEDGLDQSGRRVVALDGQLMLGLQLAEYVWTKPDADKHR